MQTSISLGKIAPALLAAQIAITFAAKDAKNPFFNSKYADLPTVIDAVKPALNANGIVFVQTLAPCASGTVSLTTRLLHVSGEWLEDSTSAPLTKNDPQAFGSAATYLRRYALAAITGLYQADDDAQTATHGAAAPAAAPAAAKAYTAPAKPAYVKPAATAAAKPAAASTAPAASKVPVSLPPDNLAEIIENGEAAAKRGLPAYAAFWKELGGVNQKAVGDVWHQANKAVATGVKLPAITE